MNKKMTTDIRPYTKAFYHGNHIRFILLLLEIILETAASMLLTWEIREIPDRVAGEKKIQPCICLPYQTIEAGYLSPVFSLILMGTLFVAALGMMFVYSPALTVISVLVSFFQYWCP